ncbi:MAG: HAD hydrolase-like protein [Pseudolysinimonas sp.]|uniref:HAD-IIA family hydrolase n=1 Tax=Pseudolysinimonas sp. TaxID=2680009 RepID=UPI003C75FE9D
MTGKPLATTTAWVIDVDGCLMRTARAGGAGGEPFPMAAELLSALKAAGQRILVCTNASQRTPAQYASHLRSVGLEISDDQVVTAGSAAADYIAAHHPTSRVLAIGAEGLVDPLRARGLAVVTTADGGPAGVVVVGAADEYLASDINAGCIAVESGASLYTTVDTPWFHGGIQKSVAVSAAIAHAIGWTTGVTPQVLGKPSPALAETLLRRLDSQPQTIAVVGDATVEIELARLMGAQSVLVLSGATSAAQFDALVGRSRPDLAVADVSELFRILFGAFPPIHSPYDKGVTA